MSHTEPVISLSLALRLRAAGLPWAPARGDHFVLPQPDLDRHVFLLSDMTVETHDLPTGRVIRFNGTTEWALDSVEQAEAVWLPAEEQLRTSLGKAFRRLEHTPEGHRVVLGAGTADAEASFERPEAVEAYGEALLHLLLHRVGPAGP